MLLWANCRNYLHKYDFEVLRAITTTDVDQHVTVPRCVDDGMVVFLIGKQCNRGADFNRTTKCETNCN